MTERFTRTKRKGLKLTPRDRQTIEAVFEARYLTNDHIGRLFYAPTTQAYCRKRCRYLFDRGYLFKRQVHMDEPDIYYLGTRGRHYIEKVRGLEREYVRKVAGVSGTGSDPSLYMEHDLTLSKLYVDARLECARWGWEYAWKNTRMLAEEIKGFEPDAWVEVARGGHAKQAFIEFTGRRPLAHELTQRLDAYARYWEAQGKGVPVLWFTTSRSQVNWLFDRISRHRYADYFLVALIENKSNFLTAPIWRWVKSQEPICFLKPPTVVYQSERGGEQG